MTQTPAIALLPYGTHLGPNLATVSTDTLTWPEDGCPKRLLGKTVADFLPSDHLLVFPKTDVHFRLKFGTRAQVSLILGEPSEISVKHLTLLRLTHRRFFKVLTFNETLLSRIPNGVFFPFGSTWVPEWRSFQYSKDKSCSLIASAKRDSTGHKLRHAVVNWARQTSQDIEVMGRGYLPFDHKGDGLGPYRFSVVIENVQEQNYFSEKLVDTILCNTVPIYWGCPNLDRFFDPAGIIQCQSEDEIRQAVQAVCEADYRVRLPQIQALQTQMADFGDIEGRAAKALRACLAE